VIRTFRSKALAELWLKSSTAKIDPKIHKRVLRRLDQLNDAESAQDMNQPGFDFHDVQGYRPARYTVHVNGPWCITFEFSGEDAVNVDFEQYH